MRFVKKRKVSLITERVRADSWKGSRSITIVVVKFTGKKRYSIPHFV